MFFSVPLKRRADKIESRKNDASAQGARSVAPDGTGGFRGITIAVSAILLALKNDRSTERNFLLLTAFSITKKVHLTSNLQLPTSNFQQADFLLSWMYQLVSTCEQPPKT